MLTIVFDLDGTLIDTAPDLISTLNFILSGDGLPPVAYNDGRRMIGGGILGMIKRALNAEGCDPPKPRLIGCFMPSSIITALHGVDGQWLKICSRFQRGGHGGVVEPLGGAHSQLNRVAQQLNEWSSETLGFETRAERDLMWCCIDRLSRQANRT